MNRSGSQLDLRLTGQLLVLNKIYEFAELIGRNDVLFEAFFPCGEKTI